MSLYKKRRRSQDGQKPARGPHPRLSALGPEQAKSRSRTLMLSYDKMESGSIPKPDDLSSLFRPSATKLLYAGEVSLMETAPDPKMPSIYHSRVPSTVSFNKTSENSSCLWVKSYVVKIQTIR